MTSAPRTGFAGHRGLLWVIAAGWVVPAMMTTAYTILMITSETDTTGKAWESMGLAFVLVLWFVFRLVTERAAMARAVAVGDAERVLELAEFQLARRGSARKKAPFSVYRALALEIREDWQGALAELDRTEQRGGFRQLAATVRTTALAELGRVAEARKVFDAELSGKPVTREHEADILARLADARLLIAEGDRAGAQALLERLCDDIRAGSGIRARAKALLAKIQKN
ncbi:MAG: hypothetical protein ACM31C_29740 [Acidobacteriota bacterium]